MEYDEIDDYFSRMEEAYKSEYEEPIDEINEDERCGCSDPTCPCSGRKRGSHHNI